MKKKEKVKEFELYLEDLNQIKQAINSATHDSKNQDSFLKELNDLFKENSLYVLGKNKKLTLNEALILTIFRQAKKISRLEDFLDTVAEKLTIDPNNERDVEFGGHYGEDALKAQEFRKYLKINPYNE